MSQTEVIRGRLKNMKFWALSLICSMTNTLMAQDTIFMANNEIILSKVISVESTKIAYKKYLNPDGPLYFMEKSQIKKIVYSNNEVDVFGSMINLTDIGKRNASVFLDIKPSDLKNFDQSALEQFQKWGYWKIEPDKRKADFIIEIEALKKGMNTFSWGGSQVQAHIYDLSGNLIWTSPIFKGESNGMTGFNPGGDAIKKLIRKGIAPQFKINN